MGTFKIYGSNECPISSKFYIVLLESICGRKLQNLSGVQKKTKKKKIKPGMMIALQPTPPPPPHPTLDLNCSLTVEQKSSCLFIWESEARDQSADLPPEKEPLDWNTRMRIAAGAAKGLEYLHDKASPPVIYRDFKPSNILLDEAFHPKLSDFGLAKLGPMGDKSHVSTRVMGTYGYCAPEYAMTGQLTVKSDVYSFGVVLLELITGRKAIDSTRAHGEQNLVSWVTDHSLHISGWLRFWIS